MGNTTFLNLAPLIILFFHFSITPTAFSMKSTTTLLTDQSALLALKHHIIHDPQNVLTSNWSASTPVCNWFGVRCGSKHRRVTALDLSGLGLVGTLPPHLGNLSFLAFFRITNNSFHGRAPIQLSNLQRLKGLSLGNNSFSGEIPSSLGSLTRLKNLYLYQNNFNDVIPFSLGYLPKLEILSLSDNQISGSIPSSIFNISSLQRISLSNNMLSGSIPSVPRDLLSLEWIDFNYNNLTGHIPKDMFDHLPNLKNLYLGDNLLSGKLPASLFKCKELQILVLTANQLEGILPIEIGNLSMLQAILIGGNYFEGEIPKQITNLTFLTLLECSGNILTGSIPNTLGNLRNLKSLKMAFNNLTSSRMSFLSSLTSCRALQVLDFGNNPFLGDQLPVLVGNLSNSLQYLYASACNIKGTIPIEVGNLTSLIAIALDYNKLTGNIPATVGGLKVLQLLALTENKLQGSIPSEICRLNKLSFLYLESNILSGPIPACLGNLISLRQLYLDSNMFSSSIPSTLTGLRDLLILNLSSNSLTGQLPIDIGTWTVMTSLDFSNNLFSGDIPTGVAHLKDLTYFSLSGNRITGSILESFGDSLSLEFLDLSRNNLSGEIPKSLEKLRYLKYFNVSFNRLHGEIPDGGSFGNYSFQSFEGNEALCGAPRLRVPSCKTRPLRNSKARTKLIISVALPIASTILVAALIIIILQKRKKKDKVATDQEDNLLPLRTWRRISHHQLHQGTDGFNEGRLLGNGSYGIVYKGILSDGMEFAVKVFKPELEGAFKSFDVECDVLRNTRHRNLIKIISCCSNDLDFKALVLEFMPNGSLDMWLHSENHCLDMLQRLNIMIDVASALEYLHHGNATPMVHCDLKPSNVLLDGDMVAHLSDFGVAKILCKEESMIQTITIATIGYMAPEYGIEGIVSTKGDVYSFGILIMEVITRKKPTNEMFGGERSLKSWVKEYVSSPLNQVVDPDLLIATGRRRSATNNCCLSILQVGLECSAELPDERLDMKETVTKLKKIKVGFLKDIQRAQ